MEELMEDFLLFVDPEIEKELDLERGFEYLDKELVDMFPKPEKPSNTKVVDKLVKVFLRDGSERWILLHIEVQGNNNKDFARRMYEYYTRILFKYSSPVAAIAVLTGKDGNKSPSAYEDRCLWMYTRYEYKTLCITDYPDELLLASMNPFAAVLLVAKEVLLWVKGSKEDRDNILYEHKELVAKLIKERMAVYGEKKTRVMMSFLNNYVVFKTPEINLKFMQRTDEIFERKNTMGYFEQLAEIRRQEAVQEGRREGLQEGRREGLQEGLQEGRRKGLQEGRREGLQEGVQKALEKAVQKLLAKTDFSPEKIAEMMEVPLDLVKKVKKDLGTK